MSKKQFILSLSLVFIASLSALLIVYNNQHIEPHKKNLKEKPDAFMLKAQYTEFNQKGRLHSTLFTPYATHYAYQNTALFEKPRMTVFTDQHIPWHIASDHGKTRQGTAWVFLWGNVILHQPPKPHNPETTMTTESLTVYPNRSFAETDQKVTIKQPGSLIKGKGLEVNMKNGTAKVLTHASGVYSPQKTTTD